MCEFFTFWFGSAMNVFRFFGLCVFQMVVSFVDLLSTFEVCLNF